MQLSVVHLEIAEDAVGYEIGRAVDLIEQVVGQIPALVHEYRIVPMEADAVDGRIREWVLGQESVCAGGLVSMRDVYQDPCIYQGAYLRIHTEYPVAQSLRLFFRHLHGILFQGVEVHVLAVGHEGTDGPGVGRNCDGVYTDICASIYVAAFEVIGGVLSRDELGHDDILSFYVHDTYVERYLRFDGVVQGLCDGIPGLEHLVIRYP